MDGDLVNRVFGIACTVVLFGGIGFGVWFMQGQTSRRRARALRVPPPLPLHRGDPLLSRLASSCLQGDLTTLHGELSAMYGDWDRRSYYLRALLADLPRSRAAIEAWASSAPADPFARLLKGLVYLAWAWEARGSGMASSVTEDGWRLFRERLEVARSELDEAARLDPRDPHPLASRVVVGMALGEPDDVLEQLYRGALARDPSHFEAHHRRLESLKKKWSGRPRAALERAREIAAGAPDGSDLPMLVVDALVEEWLALKREQGGEAARAFRLSPAFRQEARAAMDRSILHPAHVDGHGWALLAVNWGAYLAWVQDDATLLRALLERLGDKAGVIGWHVADAKLAGLVAEARVKVGLL